RGVRVQALAAEEVDLLQLPEERGARMAARGALELVHLEARLDVDLVGVEGLARVEMAGDDEHVALHVAPACALEPVVVRPVKELDEAVLSRRQVAPESFLLVG